MVTVITLSSFITAFTVKNMNKIIYTLNNFIYLIVSAFDFKTDYAIYFYALYR